MTNSNYNFIYDMVMSIYQISIYDLTLLKNRYSISFYIKYSIYRGEVYNIDYSPAQFNKFLEDEKLIKKKYLIIYFEFTNKILIFVLLN